MIKNVAVGNIPASVAFNPSNYYTYVTNVDSNTVSVINGSTNTVIDTIHVSEWLAAKIHRLATNCEHEELWKYT